MPPSLIHCTAEQRTPEWFAARLGRVTASNAAAVVSHGRGKNESVTRRDYKMQLVAERLTGAPQDDTWTSPALEHGITYEPAARDLFASMYGERVETSGFWAETDRMVGASLDGHIRRGDRELAEIVEIKCPYKTAHHLTTLRYHVIPGQYLAQVTHQAMVTGASLVHFLSYDPRLPPELQLAWVEIDTDDLDIDTYRSQLDEFLTEVAQEVDEWVSRIDRNA